eukprot:6594120-Lingulodinium_polyedra.AAC.1
MLVLRTSWTTILTTTRRPTERPAMGRPATAGSQFGGTLALPDAPTAARCKATFPVQPPKSSNN